MDNNKNRLKRLQRIVDLQHRLKQQHEWKLADLQHQQDQVVKDRTLLSQTLDKPELGGDRLLELIGKQLTVTSLKGRQIAGAKVHHHRQHEEQHRRLKSVEKVYDVAVSTYHRETQDQDLSEMIDVALLGKPK